MSDVITRRETREDREAVFEVNARAFESDAEAKLVNVVRDGPGLVISVVAEVESQVVGHILLSPVTVEKNPDGRLTLGLGPMAVVPEHQRSGIGSRLVERGLELCRDRGVEAVFVLGHADYYPRFGFRSARESGLYYQREDFDPYFMVHELEPGSAETMEGAVSYLPAFDEAGGEAE